MTAKEAQVQKLREFIDANGLRDADDIFREVLRGRDPATIRPLLLMRPYTEEDDYIDEMWTVLHAVEGFSDDVYVREFVAAVPELCTTSPDFLKLLLGRLINSETCAPIFISSAIESLPMQSKNCLKEILEGFLKLDGLSPSTTNSCKSAIAKLGV